MPLAIIGTPQFPLGLHSWQVKARNWVIGGWKVHANNYP